MQPMLNTAVKAARRAGSIINRASLELDRVQIMRKGPRDFVTDIDKAAEDAILDVLSSTYPDHDFLCEESGDINASEDNKKSEYKWIIDPLDGTTNFIHGFPVYAISIAVLQNDQLMHAVVYDPNRNELFTASRGGGAFLNDKRIRVSKQFRYSDTLLAEHIGRPVGDNQTRQAYEPMLAAGGSVRRTGSTVLDLAYVASGRLDGFCAINLKPWDVAAGGLLVLEAGGLISDLQGEQDWLDTGNVIAASPKVFAKMISYFNE